MIIDSLIKVNEFDRIREIIQNLEVLGCRKTFYDYCLACADNRSQLGSVEKLFYTKLEYNLRELVFEYRTADINAENYLPLLKELYFDGSYGFNDRPLDELIDCLIYEGTDKEWYDLIVKYMYKSLDQVSEEEEKTSKDKDEEKIKSIKESIEAHKKQIDALTESLDALTKS